jgi:hypothetical protein
MDDGVNDSDSCRRVVWHMRSGSTVRVRVRDFMLADQPGLEQRHLLPANHYIRFERGNSHRIEGHYDYRRRAEGESGEDHRVRERFERFRVGVSTTMSEERAVASVVIAWAVIVVAAIVLV